jgi:hypothetical protein
MTKLIIAIVLTLTSTFANAQLKGSGKTIAKTYNYKNFDKISFENLDGNIEVEVGKEFSILVTIDDNLDKLLSLSPDSSEKTLTISLKGNRNNTMYIKNTKINIKITMPEAYAIQNTGNSDLEVRNIFGNYFKLENTGNGDSKISGTIEVLEVNKTGNGDVNTTQLITKKAILKSTGNGDLIVNVSEELSAKLTGNGDIINKGKAKFDANSKKMGNGDLISNK